MSGEWSHQEFKLLHSEFPVHSSYHLQDHSRALYNLTEEEEEDTVMMWSRVTVPLVVVVVGVDFSPVRWVLSSMVVWFGPTPHQALSQYLGM